MYLNKLLYFIQFSSYLSLFLHCNLSFSRWIYYDLLRFLIRYYWILLDIINVFILEQKNPKHSDAAVIFTTDRLLGCCWAVCLCCIQSVCRPAYNFTSAQPVKNPCSSLKLVLPTKIKLLLVLTVGGLHTNTSHVLLKPVACYNLEKAPE